MLKRSLLLFLLLLFAVPGRNQEPVLPFTYVIEGLADGENSFVMDALSGEILYAFEAGQGVCPLGISDDGQLFVYTEYGTSNFVMTLETGTIQELQRGFLERLAWSDRYNLAAYHYTEIGINRIQVFATVRESELFQMFLVPTWVSRTTSRFVGNELFAAAFVEDNYQLFIYHWERGNQDTVVFDIGDDWGFWGDLSFSPDGRYLLAFGMEDSALVMNLETEEIFLIASGSPDTIQWLENEDATLAYLTGDGDGRIVLRHIESAEFADLEDERFINTQYSMFPSSDSHFVVYRVVDDETIDFSNLYVMDTTSEETTELGLMSSYSSQVQWLSPSQFVYRHSIIEDGQVSRTDIHFFDAETGENRQLTNTPELSERFDCFRG